MRPGGRVVVKLGGTTLAEQRPLLAELAQAVRDRPLVVVHGGGRRLTEWLGRLDVPSRFQAGLRVTDDAALEVAVALLGGLVNAELVAALRGLRADAVGLTGIDGGLLQGSRIRDLGRVARASGMRAEPLDVLLDGGFLPVIAPLALDEDGAICNVNADEAAGSLAAGLRAPLVLLTDTDGVRGADGERIETLTPEAAEHLIEDRVIDGGMVPKVRAALRALEWPGGEAVIADGSAAGALRRALEDSAFGTRIRSTQAPGRA